MEARERCLSKWSALWRMSADLDTDHRFAMARNTVRFVNACSMVILSGCVQSYSSVALVSLPTSVNPFIPQSGLARALASKTGIPSTDGGRHAACCNSSAVSHPTARCQARGANGDTHARHIDCLDPNDVLGPYPSGARSISHAAWRRRKACSTASNSAMFDMPAPCPRHPLA